MSTAHCTLGAEVPIERMAGHVFLAKMGKRLLRPGGRKGTEQLYALADLRRDQRVCEIATNRAVIRALSVSTTAGSPLRIAVTRLPS